MWIKPLISLERDRFRILFSADPEGYGHFPELLAFDISEHLRKYLRETLTVELMRTIEAEAQLFIQVAIYEKELYFDEVLDCWRYLL